MTENENEAAIVGFLLSHGWRVDRNHVGVYYTRDGRPIKIGRNGQCDWRAVRAIGCDLETVTTKISRTPRRDEILRVEYLEVEVKATGRKPKPEQEEYIALLTHLGIDATWADSLSKFQSWYDERFA